MREGLALFDRERPGETPRRVVVVVRKWPGRVAKIVATHFPASEIRLLAPRRLDRSAQQRVPSQVLVDVAGSNDDMLARIVERPSPRLIIDTRSGAAFDGVKRFRELTFALADGGSYLAIHGGAAQHDDSVAAEVTRLTSLSGNARTPQEWLDRRLQESISAMSRAGAAVLVNKTGSHHFNLGEKMATPLLTERYGTSWGRELMVRPAETLRSSITVTVNENALEKRFPKELHVPPLYLREYVDVLCAPRQLVVSGAFVVPASFHHPSMTRPRNHTLTSSGKRFATIDFDVNDAQPLPGTYFHLDSEYPHLFGHMFTEDIARLWGWDIAKGQHPQLQLLLSAHEDTPGRPPRFKVEALGAYGIDESDIVCIDRPVRVERLVTASQQFHNGKVIYASERLSETWDRLRDGLRTDSGPRFDKFFVARRGFKRSCRNADRVEATFVEHGFEIVQPETLALGEQAELFATASVIGGYAGSGMINMIHCERPGTRIVIASESYQARDLFVISAVKGDDYHHFSCPTRHPDQPDPAARPSHPSRPRSRQGLYYDYEFDFQRDGDALQTLLSST
ncbi:MAG: glycosyltransferase family 61 protein [Actinomycetota bacterium]|nr:glycosyltransferase family 61 protein [Actinomycetota bacterium]